VVNAVEGLFFKTNEIRRGDILYLLYLDDSGSIENPREEYFVFGGVCVPERSIKWLTDQMDSFAAEIDPDNPSSVEFHASEIFGGRKYPWNKYKNKSERIGIIKKVLRILDDANEDTKAFAAAVHKQSFQQHDLLRMLFEDMCSRFDIYLNRVYQDQKFCYRNKKYSHKGMIIFDKNAYEKNLENLAFEFRQDGTKWRDLRNIREVPFFVDSKSSRIIQLSDHIAYAVFRMYNADDLTYFRCIENHFDMDQGIMHGLCHRQTINQNCFCPACLTRRK